MTAEECKTLGLPEGEYAPLYAEAGLEWLRDNTTLTFDPDNPEEIKALPKSARLFLLRFVELSVQDLTVSSETMGPLSQSFVTGNFAGRVDDPARQLLRVYLKSGVSFIPCKRRWR